MLERAYFETKRMGIERTLAMYIFQKKNTKKEYKYLRNKKMENDINFLVSSISHAAILIHLLQLLYIKYEWNLLVMTSVFQIEYKIFSEHNRGTLIIILLHDENDSDV